MTRSHEFHEVTPEELAELRAQQPVIGYVPEPLTPQQRYRLVMIAHETANSAIRNAAIRLLLEAENPGIVVCPRSAP